MLSDEELAGIREKARRWRNAPCQTTIEMCDEISRLRAENESLKSSIDSEVERRVNDVLDAEWRRGLVTYEYVSCEMVKYEFDESPTWQDIQRFRLTALGWSIGMTVLRDAILRAENERLRAGRLRAETVIAARECLSVAWRDSVWGTKRIAELSDAIADLDRCSPPEEVGDAE